VSDVREAWVQCEAIRALLPLAGTAPGYRDALVRTLSFVRRHLLDPQHGGWYEAVGGRGVPTDEAKGSEWKVDHHVTAMCLEAIRLAERP
jgi:mannose/cellobiose epimerase-like protein (N-acyl-D-glucosamine 2-epimerase family)